MQFKILRYETLDSTNAEAIKQARAGADEGLCIIAAEQTAGRGRRGRTWASESDKGLYFSVVLRPKMELRHLPLITLMSGVSVFDTLAELGLDPDIKWVNDVLIGEKKICGILSESVETPRGQAVVVGIGINVRRSNYSSKFTETSTSIEEVLKQETETGKVTEVLTRYLSYFYDILIEPGGEAEIIRHWQMRSSYFDGKYVRVNLGDETVVGTTAGLDENGALKLKLDDGAMRLIQAGDVEMLRPEDA